MNTKKTIDYFVHVFLRERSKRKLPDNHRQDFFYFYAEGYAKALKDLMVLNENIVQGSGDVKLHWPDCCDYPQRKFANNMDYVTCPTCLNTIYGHLSPIFFERMTEAILRLCEKWIPKTTKRYFEKKDMGKKSGKMIKEILENSERNRKRVELEKMIAREQWREQQK